MIQVEPVRLRIEDRVPELAGRMGNAAQFSDLIENNRMPQVTPAGYVLPGVIAGGGAQVMTGFFRQDITETVMVVLAVRVAGDALGNAAIDEATPLVRDVVRGVVGWAPDGVIGVLVLGKAELVGSQAGLLLFQIDFHLNDQLRITT